MPFPSPPWQLRGQLWLSSFAVRRGTSERPAGLYGAAFVDYQEGGVLSYQELLVARLVRDGVAPRAHITDIWVNSQVSRDGGRSLWAIPKELADLHVQDRRFGPVARTSWSSNVAGEPIAAASFMGTPGLPLRTPFSFTTSQRRADGSPVMATVSGSAKTLPCLGSWRFGTDGPLAWLRGHRTLMSLRMTDFTMTFGQRPIRLPSGSLK